MSLFSSPIVMTAWLGLTLALGIFSAITVWTSPRFRFTIIGSGVASALVAYTLLSLPLGHPSAASLPKGELTVLGGRIDVDKAIYVLVAVPGEDEPLFFVLPYNVRAANQLQSAMDSQASGQTDGIKMKGGGDIQAPQAFEFYPAPQAAEPPKPSAQTPLIN